MKKIANTNPFLKIYFKVIFLLLIAQQVSSEEQSNIDDKLGRTFEEKGSSQEFQTQKLINFQKHFNSTQYDDKGIFYLQLEYTHLQKIFQKYKESKQIRIDDRFLNQVQQGIEKRDENCHYTCSSCLDDYYYSCTSCYGKRTMKETVHGEISLCRCGINSVEEGPGNCSNSTNKNLELAIKTLFSSAFGVNLFTSFVVWNPMYFLGFSEFSQVISQLAYVNKYNVLNFDEITDFITYSHIDKVFMLHSASQSTIARSNKRVGPSDVQQNPKIYLNDKDVYFVVNAITVVALHIVSWVVACFGKNSIKYKHILYISTPLVMYLITFQNLNFLALFQYTIKHTSFNVIGFLIALLTQIYIFGFTCYIFYYISIKQVLNEEKQTSKLKLYINELHQLILENPDHDDIDDDESSKQSQRTNSKLNKNKQNQDDNVSNNGKENGAHSMILKDLDNSQNNKEDLANNKENNNISPRNKINLQDFSVNKQDYLSNNKDNSPTHIRNDQYQNGNSKVLEADSTYCDNESPVKFRNMQLMSEITNKKSSTFLVENKQKDQGVKVIKLMKDQDEKSIKSDIKDDQNEIRSIEEGLESNQKMRAREEELKLKLIEQEFILQQYRSMFYLFFILLKQSNLWQRGFYTVLVLRKLLFGIINIYIYENPKTQMILLLLVDLGFVCFCVVSRPFSWRFYNILFFFFEGIALLCFIIYASIMSDNVSIDTQISSIKAILSFLIFGFIVYIIIGLTGVVFFILGLIRGPKDPLSEEEEMLKGDENKKIDEEDDYSMKKKELVKQQVDVQEEKSSPLTKNGVPRNDSPPVIQQHDHENANNPYRNRLIRPFKNESIVLLEADEEDDDDFGMNQKVTNQKDNAKPLPNSTNKPDNDEKPDDQIRRPIRYQLTQIRKKADELFQQQKEQFERNKEKRIAKTMILDGEQQNRFAATEYDLSQNQMRNEIQRDNFNNLNASQGNVDIGRSGVNAMNRRQQNDEEMSYYKNPLSMPYSFRNGDQSQIMIKESGDNTDRRIFDDKQMRHQRSNRMEDDYQNYQNQSINLPLNTKNLMNSHRKQEDELYSPNSKRGLMNKSSMQNSISQYQFQPGGISSNNNSFYTDVLNNKPGGIQAYSELQTPGNLSNRVLDNQNEPDFSLKFSPIMSKRDLQDKQKKFGFNMENFSNKDQQKPENQSNQKEYKGIEDLLEKNQKAAIPSQNNSESYQPVSQKFQYKLQKSMNSIDKQDKNDQNEPSRSHIFTKPFSRAESKFSNKSRQNLDEIESPIKSKIDQKPITNEEDKLQNQILNINEQQNSNSSSNIQVQTTQQININPKNNQSEQDKVINLNDDEDDDKEEDSTQNVHNESYIPYETDIKQYESQMNNIPTRKGKGKKFKSLIINNKIESNDKLNNTQIHSKTPIQIKENIQGENTQQEDDFNNK